jgi:hypothetical protein
MATATQIFPLGSFGLGEVSIPLIRHSDDERQSQRELSQPPMDSEILRRARSFLSNPDQVSTAMMSQQETIGSGLFLDSSSAVLSELDGLAAGSEDEIKPTDFAYTRARSLVESVYGRISVEKRLLQMAPEASITSDDQGGIRIAWTRGEKQLRANFGARENLKSYLYFESPVEHDVEELDMHHLVGRLAWLIKK